MKLVQIGVGLALVLATTSAFAEPKRVLVAGKDNDELSAKIEKELIALGFEAKRVGTLESCAKKAVITAGQENQATAAACSDGEQVGIWVTDGKALKLRDVIVAKDEGERAREITAVRAAEVTRANIALAEAEEEHAKNAPLPPVKPDPAWDSFDKPILKPAPVITTNRAATFVASAGMSGLVGADAAVGGLSGQIQVGVFKHIAASARLDFPVEFSDTQEVNSRVVVRPAMAGLGASLPLTKPSSFLIPRIGGGAGVAWLRATKPAGTVNTDPFGDTGVLITNTEGNDTAASLAFYAEAGLSMRLVGPLRLNADATLGSTTSRLVARDQGIKVAYWGQPFLVTALRAELLFQ